MLEMKVARSGELRTTPVRTLIALAACLALTNGCAGGKAPAPPPPCDQICKDNIALRSLRETMRFVYNQRLPGRPVGMQDASASCLMNGTVQIAGDAGSNPDQGATTVDLIFLFVGCFYQPAKSATHDRNYAMKLNGTVTESGTLSVQPTSTTSLVIRGDDFSFEGMVDDPAVEYRETGCAVDVAQNGNAVSGTLCGRPASFNGF
jgi:hypothetical protein